MTRKTTISSTIRRAVENAIEGIHTDDLTQLAQAAIESECQLVISTLSSKAPLLARGLFVQIIYSSPCISCASDISCITSAWAIVRASRRPLTSAERSAKAENGLPLKYKAFLKEWAKVLGVSVSVLIDRIVEATIDGEVYVKKIPMYCP